MGAVNTSCYCMRSKITNCDVKVGDKKEQCQETGNINQIMKNELKDKDSKFIQGNTEIKNEMNIINNIKIKQANLTNNNIIININETNNPEHNNMNNKNNINSNADINILSHEMPISKGYTCEKLLFKISSYLKKTPFQIDKNNNSSLPDKAIISRTVSREIKNLTKQVEANQKKAQDSQKNSTLSNYNISILNNNALLSNLEVNLSSVNEEEQHIVTEDEEENLRRVLKSKLFFKELTEEMIKLLLKEMLFFTYEKNQILYEQGDEGNFFYILAEGKIKSMISPDKDNENLKQKNYGNKTKNSREGTINNDNNNNKSNSKSNTQSDLRIKEKIYSKWDSFGELALMSKCKREETLICLTDVSIFSIEGDIFRDIEKRVNEAELRDRYNFLNTISIFQPLDHVPKHIVAVKLKIKQFQPEDKIIIKGTVGDNLYVIKNGLVSCRIESKEIRQLGNNDYFGQNAILIDMKRSCDVVAIKPTTCFEISREDLKDALGSKYIDTILFSFFKNCIDKSKNFKEIFISSKQAEIFKNFSIKQYDKRENIFNKNKDNRRIICIIDGSLYVNEGKKTILYGQKGDLIGDSLIHEVESELPSTLFANPDCITFECSLEIICRILGIVQISPSMSKPLESPKKKNNMLNIYNRMQKLKKLDLFKNLSDKTIEKLAKELTKKNFEENEIIFEEGEKGDCFYLISQGRVEISVKGKFLRNLDAGNCFGEIALLSTCEKRTATVKANTKVSCYLLSKGQFDLIIIDRKVKEYMIKKIALQDTTIELKDLQYIKHLGKGKFGNVNLVHNSKNIYAIKAVSRKSVENQKMLAKYFVNERRILLSLDHPFIVKMVKSLRNNNYCFFLMEYVNGRNMDEYLSKYNPNQEFEMTQFYIASLLIILEYLQKKFIAHRDIKPSNIMIDSNGYLKMIDFGTAKVLTDYTYTVIGTPHYIAPEILNGKGYSLSCDFWSLGICTYEIYYAIYPFGNCANEVIEIYKEILHQDLQFPSDNNENFKINSFIKDLLKKKVNLRTCNVQALKEKEFFNDFEWDKLIDFQIEPPYIPSSKDFSECFKINDPFEEYVKEDKTHSPRRKGKEEIPKDYDKKWFEEF